MILVCMRAFCRITFTQAERSLKTALAHNPEYPNTTDLYVHKALKFDPQLCIHQA